MAKPRKGVLRSKTTQNVAAPGGVLTLLLLIAAGIRDANPGVIPWDVGMDEVILSGVVTVLGALGGRALAHFREWRTERKARRGLYRAGKRILPVLLCAGLALGAVQGCALTSEQRAQLNDALDVAFALAAERLPEWIELAREHGLLSDEASDDEVVRMLIRDRLREEVYFTLLREERLPTAAELLEAIREIDIPDAAAG